ncbi:MAG: iron-only hydrogenase system regulator [Lachnospiraceae bacterium]|nr:iron-only hydrogenase system regulator [Lachnospiraceae bacterium]MBR4753890.1 iron-only hydrogenase system regulator [Lachnospiraceae bacterium]
MESRVAIIGIIVENEDSVLRIQEQLSKYSEYIIGRMGIPYRERNIRVISIAIDAPMDIINALTGKIGRLDGVSAKAVYQKSID